jgi:broad specificity phosphatase PhoE
MTTLLLVRHAEHALQNRVLVGRMDDVALSQAGRAQLSPLAEALRSRPIAAVHSSPRQRARETADAVAACHALPVEVFDALDEIDYGEWTGLDFAALEVRPDWQAWNARRGSSTPPMGESMGALQRRVLAYLEDVRCVYGDKTVAVVTHAEPIRAILLHAMGFTLNEFSRIDIATASITPLRAAERNSAIVPEWKVASA